MDEYIMQINRNAVKNPARFLDRVKECPMVQRSQSQPEYHGCTERNVIYKVEGIAGVAATLFSMRQQGIERVVVRCLKNGKNRRK
ncbi:hypothetical protein KY311_03935 [Candidatus Woesearchaeota archaeon]|nr:hypothetical protein [Candidatus Woesearchaeota archaeon]